MGEIVPGQRRRFPVVGHEAGLQRLGIVVCADRAAGSQRLAGAVFDTVDQDLVINLELNDGVKLFT